MVRGFIASLMLVLPVVGWCKMPWAQAAAVAGLSEAQVLAADGVVLNESIPMAVPLNLRLERDSTLVDPRQAVIEKALAAVGVRYRYGQANLKTGVDCSGLIKAAFKEGAGIDLPRRASAQAQVATPVERGSEAVGDLVFFNTRGGKYSHVGLVTGGKKFVHASLIERRVTIADMDNRYWRRRFTEARRVPLPEVAAATVAAAH